MAFFQEIKRKFNLETVNLNPEHDFRVIKNDTIQNWINDPCESAYSDKKKLSKEYFNEIREKRYSSHPWILEDINSFDLNNKKALEIGFGIGTDHYSMARKGGTMYGIDMGITNNEYTKAQFLLYKHQTRLTMGDAEFLPFRDESFDFVYSFGAIHHSPDTHKIISETRRVLKPGGKCYITVYHKHSFFFWWTIFFNNYLLGQGWKKRTLRQQISLLEYPNNRENMVVKLYQKNQFKDLFKDYTLVKACIKHFIPADLNIIGTFFREPNKPRPFFTRLGKRFGWYVVVKATK